MAGVGLGVQPTLAFKAIGLFIWSSAMMQSVEDVNTGADETVQDPSSGNQTHDVITVDNSDNAEPDSTVQADDNGHAKEHMIPKSRFDEVNEARKSALEQADKQQGTIQSLIRTIQENRQPAPSAQPTNTPDDSDWSQDPVLQNLRGQFTNDEDGEKTFRTFLSAINHVSDTRVTAGLNKTSEEIKISTAQLVDSKINGITTTIAVNKEISGMLNKGLIDVAARDKIVQEMNKMKATNREWEKAENQPHLLNTVYMGMLQRGEVKPGSYNKQGTRNNPLQPGNRGGGTRSRADAEASAKAVRDKLRNDPKFRNSLGKLSDQELQKAMSPDTRSPNIVNTEGGLMDSRVASDSFQHTRD